VPNVTVDLATHTATGSITFPANLAGCDSSLSGAIVIVNVFAESDGVNTEASLTALTMPF
jgi:hypothetical protein